MAITNSVTIELEMNRPNDLVIVHAVQGEYYSRQVVAKLFNEGSAYTIPSEAVAVIRYRKPDGSVGFYDYDPAGHRIVTITNSNKAVTLTLAAEMCDLPGRVSAHIDLYSKTSGNRLSAFYFYVDVEKAATDDDVVRMNNVTGLQDVLKNVIENVYTPGEAFTGVVVDNTLQIPGAVSDAKAVGDAIDDIVYSSNSSPNPRTHPFNKIWIKKKVDNEIEVPEMSDIVDTYSETLYYYMNDYVSHNGHFYKCLESSVHGTWDESKWQQIDIGDEVSTDTKVLFNSMETMDSSMPYWVFGQTVAIDDQNRESFIEKKNMVVTRLFQIQKDTIIQNLIPASDDENNAFTDLVINFYRGNTYVSSHVLSTNEFIKVPSSGITQIRITFGYQNEAKTITRYAVSKYFKIKMSQPASEWRVKEKPWLVAFGASLGHGVIHNYSGQANSGSDYKYPEYVASTLNMNCANLCVSSTGFLGRGKDSNAGKLNNFMDQIISNGDILSKASLVLIVYGGENDNSIAVTEEAPVSYRSLPVGNYDDYYPYDEEGYNAPGTIGIERMLNRGATFFGCLNWCIKYLNTHYPEAQVVFIFGSPWTNRFRKISMIPKSEGPGQAPYQLNFKDLYIRYPHPGDADYERGDESYEGLRTFVRDASEELVKWKDAFRIPVFNLFDENGLYTHWGVMSTKQYQEMGLTYEKYAVFSTEGTKENPVWNFHPNDAGYIRYCREIAGRVASLYQYRY